MYVFFSIGMRFFVNTSEKFLVEHALFNLSFLFKIIPYYKLTKLFSKNQAFSFIFVKSIFWRIAENISVEKLKI